MLEQDFSKPVIRLMAETPNTEAGMQDIVKAAEQAREEIEERMTELLAQRDTVVTVARNYARLYEILSGENLRGDVPFDSYLGRLESYRPNEIVSMERSRQDVLRWAEAGAQNDGTVSTDFILNNMGGSPWKNPKAVIGTILARSRRYKKSKKEGFYDRVGDAKADGGVA